MFFSHLYNAIKTQKVFVISYCNQAKRKTVISPDSFTECDRRRQAIIIRLRLGYRACAASRNISALTLLYSNQSSREVGCSSSNITWRFVSLERKKCSPNRAKMITYHITGSSTCTELFLTIGFIQILWILAQSLARDVLNEQFAIMSSTAEKHWRISIHMNLSYSCYQ